MKKMLTLSILSISMITVMAGAAVSPALGNISTAFPDSSASEIKMILTLPALFIIVFSLISGSLLARFSKKQILISGIIIYLIGGVGPVFTDNIYSILICRAILGIGCGLIMPLSQSLIPDFFTTDECQKMAGYSGAAANLMGIISAVLVGQLSSIHWKYGFYIYFIALLVLLLNVLALPSQQPVIKKGTSAINKKVYVLAVCMCLTTIAFYAVPTNIALFMKNEQIGNYSSPGLVIAVFTLGGFLAGMILGVIPKKLQNSIIPSSLALMSLGYTILFYAYSLYQIILAVAFVGFSFGLIYPLLFLKSNQSVDKSSRGAAVALVSSCLFLGQFLSPIILQFASNLLSVHTPRFSFAFLAVCLGIMLIIVLLLQLIAPKKQVLFEPKNKEDYLDA